MASATESRDWTAPAPADVLKEGRSSKLRIIGNDDFLGWDEREEPTVREPFATMAELIRAP